MRSAWVWLVAACLAGGCGGRSEADDTGRFPLAVAEVMDQVRDTDFPARAEAIAAQVARTDPHVISLQEVSRS